MQRGVIESDIRLNRDKMNALKTRLEILSLILMLPVI